MKTRTDQRAARWNALSVATAGMAAIFLGSVLGGCAAPMERAGTHAGSRPGAGSEVWEGAGSSWALVMQSPRTTQMLAATDARMAPEYGRNDAALGAGRDQPVLASNEWPERERPDLYYARRIQLETRGDEFLYFDTRARYSGYRGGGSRGTYYPGTGTYGFWR